MTNKTIITIIAVLVLVITIPTALAIHGELKPTEESWFNTCANHQQDPDTSIFDFVCAVDIYQMYHDINTLFEKTDTLETKTDQNSKNIHSLATGWNSNKVFISKLSSAQVISNAEIDDIETRLQVLEGIIPPPEETHPLVVILIPDSIDEGEKFTVYGHVNRIEQYWVDFTVYHPNGNPIQWFDINTLQNGGFYPPAISPNHKWNMNGTYTIIAEHGPHSTNSTIQYTMGSNP